MMKIDTHIHLTPPCVAGRCHKLKETEAYWKLLAESPQNKFADGEDVIKELDRTGIDKAVVFGFSFQDMGLCREVNDYTMEMVKKYPDRLIGFMSISPAQKGLEAEIDRCIGGGLKGIGELFPDGQGIDITREEDTRELAGLCLERALPVMVHSNERVGHYYTGKVSTTPYEAAKMAEHHPDLTLIFAHWGGGLFFYELMKEIRKTCQNVYYDIAASIFLYDKSIFKVAREIGVLDKVLFASDFPLVSPERYFKYLEESGLDHEDIRKVYGGNAKKLLKIL